jgi:5-methylcytosine-specific restriction endonuclease McrA
MATHIEKTVRPKEIPHDETPSDIVSHPFEPKAQWWTLCKHCNHAESAHKETTLRFHYLDDYEGAFE